MARHTKHPKFIGPRRYQPKKSHRAGRHIAGPISERTDHRGWPQWHQHKYGYVSNMTGRRENQVIALTRANQGGRISNWAKKMLPKLRANHARKTRVAKMGFRKKFGFKNKFL